MTSFLVTFKVEKSRAICLKFDGPDSKGKCVSVRIDTKRKYTGNNNDDYGFNYPPPIFYTLNEVFFIFNSKNGGEILYNKRDFNEFVSILMVTYS